MRKTRLSVSCLPPGMFPALLLEDNHFTIPKLLLHHTRPQNESQLVQLMR